MKIEDKEDVLGICDLCMEPAHLTYDITIQNETIESCEKCFQIVTLFCNKINFKDLYDLQKLD